MTSRVQGPAELPEPAAELLASVRRTAPGWLARVTRAAAARGGVTIAPGDPELDGVVAAATERLLDDLEALLATDVDEQRTNPLSLLRAAVTGPTDLLRRRDVPPPAPDAFLAEHFPRDTYGLGPATWADVDPSVHATGIAWGAWKAMTVLRRRREEGRR